MLEDKEHQRIHTQNNAICYPFVFAITVINHCDQTVLPFSQHSEVELTSSLQPGIIAQKVPQKDILHLRKSVKAAVCNLDSQLNPQVLPVDKCLTFGCPTGLNNYNTEGCCHNCSFGLQVNHN